MIYVLGTKQAQERNLQEGAKYSWGSIVKSEPKQWQEIEFGDYTALVVGDGQFLTEEELAKCEEMPESFEGYVPERFRGITNVVVTDIFEESYCNISAIINGLETQLNGYYYENGYWDNYTVMEWIISQL